jgi:hypothetical protein
MKIVSVARKLSKTDELSKARYICFGEEITGINAIARKNLSWVRIPAKMVCVAWKLRTIREQRQDLSCLFRRGDYRNKDHNPEVLCCVCFGMEITEIETTIPKCYAVFVSAWRLQK